MRHTGTIAARELRSLFGSPVAYAILTLFAVLAGFFFLTNVLAFHDIVQRYQQFQAFEQLRDLNLNDHVITYFFGVMAVIMLFVVPGITMGLLAAEKANGTEELLLTSPITVWELVLGKFLAGAAFVTILVALVAFFPGILLVADELAAVLPEGMRLPGGDPELLRTLAGLLGLLLVGLGHVAVGLFASAMTRSQLIAFFVTFVIVMLFWMLSFLADLGVAGGASLGGGVGDLLRYLATADHFEQLLKGLVHTADLAYFAVLIASFLILSKAAVESVRWR